jgi:hypothetical protein
MRSRHGRRWRRLAARTFSLAALAAAPLGGLVQTQTAAALAPSTVAYWVKLGIAVPTVPKGGLLVANDPTSAASPTAAPPVPGVAVPAPPPPPKGVPTLTGPTAVSTVKIDGVTQGAAATLTLKVAPGSVPPPPSTTTMVACVIHTAWTAPAGGTGDITSAPTSDCSSASSGKVAADNSTVSWLLPSSFQDSSGALDIELEPNPAGSAVPFAVSFAPPDASALQLASGPPAPALPPPAPEPAAEATATAAAPPDFSALPAAPSYSAPAPVTSVTHPSPVRPQVTLASPAVHVPTVVDDRGHRIMAVVALFVLALAWWWIGSRPTRAPRLLGALAAGASRPGAGVPAVRSAGIGRFARMHSGVPRRI